MAVRHRWPGWASARSKVVQRAAFVLLAVLLLLIVTVERERIWSGLSDIVSFAAAFVVASFGAGWLAGAAVRASGADRFTLAAEFATRNVAVATAIAVTLLGRTEFAAFASVYFLTELPLMLAAVAVWRRMQVRAWVASVTGRLGFVAVGGRGPGARYVESDRPRSGNGGHLRREGHGAGAGRCGTGGGPDVGGRLEPEGRARH